jgi:hypothetical protein
VRKFRIVNQFSGVDLGVYEGADEEAALDALAQDAGYYDFKNACRILEDSGDDLVVTEVEEE